MEPKPESTALSTRLLTSSGVCARLTATCTSGSKSWMPRLRRLKPSSARCRMRSASTRARIDFDGKLAIVAVVEIERIAQMIHQLAELVAIEVGRCAAAEMQLFDLAATVEQRRLHVDFAVQHLEVAIDACLVVRDDLVAAAVVAKRMAKRDVHIQRQRHAAVVAGDGVSR